jgi:two-component system sensor histidine kinase BaeS
MTQPNLKIGTRLLLAQAIVVIAAIATAGAIAAVVGPPLFHQHMLRADHPPDPSELMHVEEAYRTTSLISLGIAVAVAAVLAMSVSWYLTRRFQRPILTLTRAATRVSEGDYAVTVPTEGAGPELDTLATAFNAMAATLAGTEDTRRRLLSDLAHELRTPLATLTAYLEGIDDEVEPWNEATRGILGDQVARLARLAKDLDAVSRAEEGHLGLEIQPVSVRELAEAAVLAQSDAFRAKGVDLEAVTSVDANIPADRTRLHQVLANLLDNARRHTARGGNVTLAWQHTHDEVAISVTDTGEGISAAQLPHIFERFYRGDTARDREQQGSGIGLTISRAIVQAHGGRLEAMSIGPGAGATFTLTLPMTAGART